MWAEPIAPAIEPSRLQSGLVLGRVLIRPFEQLDGVARHYGGNGMFVDELGMTITPEQHTEIVEPGHHALKLHAVHKKDRERSLVLADVIEERILQVLGAVGRHCRCSMFLEVVMPRGITGA